MMNSAIISNHHRLEYGDHLHDYLILLKSDSLRHYSLSHQHQNIRNRHVLHATDPMMVVTASTRGVEGGQAVSAKRTSILS